MEPQIAAESFDRRDFLKGTAGLAAAATVSSAFADQPAPKPRKTIGIQVGAASFVDEGVDPVLDILQERGQINTIYLATFTYGRGIAGRQIPGQPLPDHGKKEYDTDTFHGGSYTAIPPQYYKK